MFQADICNHANLGRDDIRSIQTTTQTRFNNGNLHLACGKEVEGHSRCHLKKREVQLAHLRLMARNEIDNLSLGYHLAIHAHTFAEVAQVWRGEQSHAVASVLQHRGQHMRYGTLAVGTSDVDCEIILLRITQIVAEVAYALQTRFISIGTHLLE